MKHRYHQAVTLLLLLMLLLQMASSSSAETLTKLGKGDCWAHSYQNVSLITVASLPETGIDTLRSVPPTITEVRTR